jgi:hypothetical protein
MPAGIDRTMEAMLTAGIEQLHQKLRLHQGFAS